MKFVEQVIAALLDNQLRRATKFVSPTEVVAAQRITYKGRLDRREKSIDIRLKIGRPNYHERQLVKDFIKAGEPFPVKKIRFSHFRPKTKKGKSHAAKSSKLHTSRAASRQRDGR